MEENKVKEMKNAKPTYEQLEVQYKSVFTQAERILDENEKLKKLNDELIRRLNSNDINFAFKVLEFRELFNQEFVKKVVNKLEEILTPDSQEENKEGEE